MGTSLMVKFLGWRNRMRDGRGAKGADIRWNNTTLSSLAETWFSVVRQEGVGWDRKRMQRERGPQNFRLLSSTEPNGNGLHPTCTIKGIPPSYREGFQRSRPFETAAGSPYAMFRRSRGPGPPKGWRIGNGCATNGGEPGPTANSGHLPDMSWKYR